MLTFTYLTSVTHIDMNLVKLTLNCRGEEYNVRIEIYKAVSYIVHKSSCFKLSTFIIFHFLVSSLFNNSVLFLQS